MTLMLALSLFGVGLFTYFGWVHGRRMRLARTPGQKAAIVVDCWIAGGFLGIFLILSVVAWRGL